MNDKTNGSSGTNNQGWKEYHTTPTCDTDPKQHLCADCGWKYVRKFVIYKYGINYGPVYRSSIHLKDFLYFDEMIKNGILTEKEKEVMCGVSVNEGDLDGLQAYDDQILSVGPMQATINIKGHGQFPKQVAKFKQEYKQLYTELFELCGWTVEGDGDNAIMKYQHEMLTNGKKIIGKELRKKFHANCNALTQGKTPSATNTIPLAVIVNAILHKEFQQIQVIHFKEDLRTTLAIKTKHGFKISDYLKSNLGQATALDGHVNRPNFVKKDFDDALDYVAQHNNIKHDPTKWGSNHSTYEKILVDYYGNHRRMTGYPPSYAESVKRYNKLLAVFKAK